MRPMSPVVRNILSWGDWPMRPMSFNLFGPVVLQFSCGDWPMQPMSFNVL